MVVIVIVIVGVLVSLSAREEGDLCLRFFDGLVRRSKSHGLRQTQLRRRRGDATMCDGEDARSWGWSGGWRWSWSDGGCWMSMSM